MTRQALAAGERVVVRDTCVRFSELIVDLEMTPKAMIFEATGTWENVHSVPDGILQRMAQR